MSSTDGPSLADVGQLDGAASQSAVRAALDLLWMKGYHATSLDDLTSAMGLSRSNFYACFGSKHAVLTASVGAYADDKLAILQGIAADEADPRSAARAMLAAVADVHGGRRGCFFANMVTELAAQDPELAALAQVHLGQFTAIMTETLRRSGCDAAPAAERAGAMLAMALGATILRKAGLPPAAIAGLLAHADDLFPSVR